MEFHDYEPELIIVASLIKLFDFFFHHSPKLLLVLQRHLRRLRRLRKARSPLAHVEPGDRPGPIRKPGDVDAAPCVSEPATGVAQAPAVPGSRRRTRKRRTTVASVDAGREPS